MSSESIACCLTCHMTFATHEELFVHTCSQIKVEIDEVDTEKQFESVVQEDFKNEIDPSYVSEIDYSPKKKISKKSKTQKKEGKKQKNGEEAAVSEGTKKKKRRIKKEKLKAEFKLEPTDFVNLEHFDMGDNYNLELSEEFISLILQQVDDLCEKIKHGDPDIQRALEVNKNLNDAVSCYVRKLVPKRKTEEKRKIGRPKTEKPLIEFSDTYISQKTDEYLKKIEKGCSELDVPFDKFVSKLATRYYFTNGENQDKKKGHMFNKVTLLEFIIFNIK